MNSFLLNNKLKTITVGASFTVPTLWSYEVQPSKFTGCCAIKTN